MATTNLTKLCMKHGFYNGDRCSQCDKESNRHYSKYIRAKDRQKIYNSRDWKKVRALTLIRDIFLCQECLRNGIETIGDTVHHKTELSEDITLAFDLDNLETVCRSCHNKHHGREGVN